MDRSRFAPGRFSFAARACILLAVVASFLLPQTAATTPTQYSCDGITAPWATCYYAGTLWSTNPDPFCTSYGVFTGTTYVDLMAPSMSFTVFWVHAECEFVKGVYQGGSISMGGTPVLGMPMDVVIAGSSAGAWKAGIFA